MKTENISIPPNTKGMISSMSHYSAPANSWSCLENFNTDNTGVLTTRRNIYSATTGSILTSVKGIGFNESGNFFIKDGVRLLQGIAASEAMSVIDANYFTSSTSLARFDNLQESIFIASSGNLVRYRPGNAAAESSLSMSSAVSILCCGFVGRIWGSAPSATQKGDIFYTDVLPPDITTAPITGGSSKIRLNTKGKSILALIDQTNVMYAFTANNIFRVYNINSVDNAPFANVGTFRQETVVRTPNSIFFLHHTGVYEITQGQVQKVSGAIDNWFETASFFRDADVGLADNYVKNVFGWYDNNNVYFSVGTNQVSVADSPNTTDRSYTIKYNHTEKTCSVNSYSDFYFQNAATKNFSSQSSDDDFFDTEPFTVIAGSNIAKTINKLGFLFTYKYNNNKSFSSGVSFQGNPMGDFTLLGSGYGTGITATVPIQCTGETQWITFDKENILKEISGISIASENGAGFKLMYQVDNDQDQVADRNNAVWKEIGTIKDDYITMFREFKSGNFNRIKFKVSGSSLGAPVTIGQITFLTVQSKGYGQG